MIKVIAINLILLLMTGCADTYNIYQYESPKTIIALDNKAKLINQISPIKSQAVINFVGKVTQKKTNDLTSYIHKQMNDGVKDFMIVINSGGGDSDASIAAYQYLKQLPVSITTYNIGNVQSSAALLYCSGTKRYALANSFFMLHGSSTTYAEGMSLAKVEALLKLGKIHQQAFVDIFQTCTNLSISLLEKYFSSADSNYFTVTEAQKMGFVQEIAAPQFFKQAILYNITD